MSKARDNRRRKARARKRLVLWAAKRERDRKIRERYDRAVYVQYDGMRSAVEHWAYTERLGNPALLRQEDLDKLVPMLSLVVCEMLWVKAPKGEPSASDRAMDMFLKWFDGQYLCHSVYSVTNIEGMKKIILTTEPAPHPRRITTSTMFIGNPPVAILV